MHHVYLTWPICGAAHWSDGCPGLGAKLPYSAACAGAPLGAGLVGGTYMLSGDFLC